VTVIGAIGAWLYIAIVAAVALSVFLLGRMPGVARWNRRVAPHLYRVYGPKGELHGTEEDRESNQD
jgi:hypothetical protein